jgi:hypothetical protein
VCLPVYISPASILSQLGRTASSHRTVGRQESGQLGQYRAGRGDGIYWLSWSGGEHGGCADDALHSFGWVDKLVEESL